MVKTIKKFQKDAGFTLVEVMIAMTIFALFITAFLMSQGANINSSINMEEDLLMQSLAERKMNEILLDKPVFTNATENEIITKNFEEEEFKKYKYSIEYKKLVFPNFQQLTGNLEEEQNRYEEDQTQAIKKMVFDKLKKNLEQMLWQARVTITNPETNYQYSLSTWLTNDDAKIDTNFGI
ncbi:MAG: prepilin-type N-terminal cleavage/methylation domain-containing protein [Bacteriovoracaceae bacterium]